MLHFPGVVIGNLHVDDSHGIVAEHTNMKRIVLLKTTLC